MSLLYAVAGFAAGVFVGIGATLFYLKWKMGKQLGMMEEQMEEMMDMTGDMEDAFGDLDIEEQELEEVGVEEKDGKEKENK